MRSRLEWQPSILVRRKKLRLISFACGTVEQRNDVIFGHKMMEEASDEMVST